MSDQTFTYSARGYVYGTTWDFSKGAYPAKDYNDYTDEDELKAAIKKDFESGALDSGFGFQHLDAADMTITIRDTIVVNGKLYHRYDRESYILGKDEDVEKLNDIVSNME